MMVLTLLFMLPSLIMALLIYWQYQPKLEGPRGKALQYFDIWVTGVIPLICAGIISGFKNSMIGDMEQEWWAVLATLSC
ncbi:MAG: hypothetical protein ABH845_00500, partial [Candidatus Omnitrophota bacterium]